MISRSASFMALALVPLAFFAPSALGQVTITTNEPVKGRFSGNNGEIHTYSVLLLKDEGRVRFRLTSRTLEVLAFLKYDTGQGRTLTLMPLNGQGSRAAAFGVYGQNVEAEPKDGFLPAGRYTISLQPSKQGGAGPYTIQVVEPKFEAPAVADAGPPPAGDPTGDQRVEMARLRNEIGMLRRQLTEMERRLKSLEQGAAASARSRPRTPR